MPIQIMDATGTGCVIYKCEVFDKIDYPWFETNRYEGNEPGEDIRFCQKLKAAGYSIWVQRSVDVPQKTGIIVNQAFHDVYNKIEGKGVKR